MWSCTQGRPSPLISPPLSDGGCCQLPPRTGLLNLPYLDCSIEGECTFLPVPTPMGPLGLCWGAWQFHCLTKLLREQSLRAVLSTNPRTASVSLTFPGAGGWRLAAVGGRGPVYPEGEEITHLRFCSMLRFDGGDCPWGSRCVRRMRARPWDGGASGFLTLPAAPALGP